MMYSDCPAVVQITGGKKGILFQKRVIEKNKKTKQK